MNDTKFDYVLRSKRRWSNSNIQEMWSYRELLLIFVWRDITVKYKQTILGILWAILQPFALMILFSTFFGQLIKVPSDNIPYPLFSYSALVPWQFFVSGLTKASHSLVANANILKKVYFPRIYLPLAAVISSSVDFMMAFFVLLLLMASYGRMPGIRVLWLLPLIILLMSVAFGMGLWLSALYIRFRDVGYIIPFSTQVLLFLTPIIYPRSILPENFWIVYNLNPMVSVVEGFRWVLLDAGDISFSFHFSSVLIAFIIFASGLLFFGYNEQSFADEV